MNERSDKQKRGKEKREMFYVEKEEKRGKGGEKLDPVVHEKRNPHQHCRHHES